MSKADYTLSNLTFEPYKIPRLFCPRHPDFLIKSFCFKDACELQYICSRCEIDHPTDHRNTTKSINSIANNQAINYYLKKLENNFLSNNIAPVQKQISENLDSVETEIINTVRDLKDKFNQYLKNLATVVDARVDTHREFVEHLKEAKIRKYLSPEEASLLVESCKRLEKESAEVFSIDINSLPKRIDQEAQTIIHHAKTKLLELVDESLNSAQKQLNSPKYKDSFSIPAGFGQFDACTYIPKFKVLAIGFHEYFGVSRERRDLMRIFDPRTKETLIEFKEHHRNTINDMIYTNKYSNIIISAGENIIKVHKILLLDKQIKITATLRTYAKNVRILKYIEEEDLLISADYHTKIELWSLRRLRKAGEILTTSGEETTGTMSYIAAQKLIGVAFSSGLIRFYHLLIRDIRLEINTGFSRYHIRGLQYLPKRNLIMADISHKKICLWKYEPNKEELDIDFIIDMKSSSPTCLFVSDNEEQILYTTAESFYDTYSFETGNIARYDINDGYKYRVLSSITQLEPEEIMIIDCYSADFFLFG